MVKIKVEFFGGKYADTKEQLVDRTKILQNAKSKEAVQEAITWAHGLIPVLIMGRTYRITEI